MKRLKDRYCGDTLIFTGNYKVGGVPTAIPNGMTLSIFAQTTAGVFELDVVVNPDQVTNVGQFAAGAVMTDWGIGTVSIQAGKVVDGQTPIPAINQVRDHTPMIQFLLLEPIE